MINFRLISRGQRTLMSLIARFGTRVDPVGERTDLPIFVHFVCWKSLLYRGSGHKYGVTRGDGSEAIVTCFVLIHGTTQGPRGWDRVARSLTAAGHTIRAVELDSSTQTTPQEYARTIAASADVPRGSVVVAHSGAGLILPAVARELDAALQVWVAAMIPDGEHALLEEIRQSPAPIFHPDWIGVDPVTDHEAALHFLFHDCDPRTQQWALGTLRLFVPGYAYAHPVSLTPEIPSLYIAAALDRTLIPNWCVEAAAHRLGVRAVEMRTGHCPHVSAPEALARLLAEHTGTTSLAT
ncbi:alpha/beta fold hydrolase [Nocardia sp. CDC160]|uniref:alpha/beta fold hydrolase n=1 Tax=Nocardia sp. CDC160 TaxID=3112166 RepID=UPI002DB78242|nr:alpha/beta hydrolase [Nocardia sp. CDC160]MEC3918587.1 alpha/beta hydrolase [Nocardia sp. CDC160]